MFFFIISIENNIGIVFNFTLTYINDLSHNVTLSINKRVKEILTRSWYWRGGGEFALSRCVCVCVFAWPSSSGVSDWTCCDDDSL